MTSGECPVWRRVRTATAEDPVPTAGELHMALQVRLEVVGEAAFSSFVRAQTRAAKIWGPKRTAHFGMVLRALRVTEKTEVHDRWDRAVARARCLPDSWCETFMQRIELSRRGDRDDRHLMLSAAYLDSMARAWHLWLEYCADLNLDTCPTGGTLEAFAKRLLAGPEPASIRTCSDYINRIIATWRLRYPGFATIGVEYVAGHYREQSDLLGATTKTGSQLVGASTIYDLGFELMKRGRTRSLRGVHAARDFRNGLLLALGGAIPERARALSVLEYDQTLLLPERGLIELRLPGEALKLPEAEKGNVVLVRQFRNERLWDALVEYRRDFRPLFDAGAWLFPSMLAKRPITEQRIGVLTGDLTKRELGVRVPIHRLRDNVATEASETLDLGARAATPLLGHRSLATAQRHYDHSQGVKAAHEHAGFLDARRSNPCSLSL